MELLKETMKGTTSKRALSLFKTVLLIGRFLKLGFSKYLVHFYDLLLNEIYYQNISRLFQSYKLIGRMAHTQFEQATKVFVVI